MKAGQRVASSPDDYVAHLSGWQRSTVESLRQAVMRASPLDERIKWTHLVYFSNGPLLLIRAESARVLFGFWRGKRLREIEPRLKPGGKYELATMVFGDGDTVAPEIVARLVHEAIRLNAELGDPTRATSA